MIILACILAIFVIQSSIHFFVFCAKIWRKTACLFMYNSNPIGLILANDFSKGTYKIKLYFV